MTDTQKAPFLISENDPESFDRAIITLDNAPDLPMQLHVDGETYQTTKADMMAAFRAMKAATGT